MATGVEQLAALAVPYVGALGPDDHPRVLAGEVAVQLAEVGEEVPDRVASAGPSVRLGRQPGHSCGRLKCQRCWTLTALSRDRQDARATCAAETSTTFSYHHALRISHDQTPGCARSPERHVRNGLPILVRPESGKAPRGRFLTWPLLGVTTSSSTSSRTDRTRLRSVHPRTIVHCRIESLPRRSRSSPGAFPRSGSETATASPSLCRRGPSSSSCFWRSRRSAPRPRRSTPRTAGRSSRSISRISRLVRFSCRTASWKRRETRRRRACC